MGSHVTEKPKSTKSSEEKARLYFTGHKASLQAAVSVVTVVWPFSRILATAQKHVYKEHRLKVNRRTH